MEEWEVPVEWALWEVSQAQCKCQEAELVVQVVQEQVELVEPEEQEPEQQEAWEVQEVWEACHQEWA